ncbi:SURF1 family protein [Salinibacterium sp. SYSU T00001]|uniref:SURF1 family cytochrome oxidase biogenesis protein n=1 Tax=Homoserinimonas sedimenticola TaxID=2986805 RepID=UPI002236427A|nr:SURF1 family protein [Salinibacterium sedimenticola]MCW4384416.1 SURF1 family protein [Salinibacterium sedimenticola]
MSSWRFVLTPRWAGYFALVVVFAIVSVGFGNWQFDRRAEAQHAIGLVEDNYDREPEPLHEVLPTLDAYDDEQQWTPVVLQGKYLRDEELLVRNRPLRGAPGFEVLTPLQLDDGSVFVVDRGWVPTGSAQDEPDAVPAAPEGRVTVVARLKAGEPTLPGRGAPAGTNQIATIHLTEVAERLGLPTYTGAYGLVASQDPAPAEALLTPPRPEPDEGPHLSYALQWYVFALLAFVGLGWALRQEYRVVNSDDERVRRAAERRESRRSRRAPTDDEIEDALLDEARG